MNPAASSPPVILRGSEGSSTGNPRIPARSEEQTLNVWPIDEEVARQWWPRPEPQPSCKGRFFTKICGHKARLYRLGCGNVKCRACERKNRRRRAERILAKVTAVRDGCPLIYIIPTVPEQYRHLAASPRTWQSWRRRYIKWLKKTFGFRYLHERTDPAGKCPQANKTGDPCSCLRCVKWHPHMNILAVAAGSLVPSGVFSKAQTEAVKAEWKRIIGATGRVNVRIDNSRWNRRFNRRCTDSEEESKIWHWCSYQGRPWADWQKSVRKHMVPRWYGKKIVVPPLEKKAPTCPECGQEFVLMECYGGEEEAAFWASLGPEAARAEFDRRMAARRERRLESIGPPAFRGLAGGSA